jgi:hypothetical protein
MMPRPKGSIVNHMDPRIIWLMGAYLVWTVYIVQSILMPVFDLNTGPLAHDQLDICQASNFLELLALWASWILPKFSRHCIL